MKNIIRIVCFVVLCGKAHSQGFGGNVGFNFGNVAWGNLTFAAPLAAPGYYAVPTNYLVGGNYANYTTSYTAYSVPVTQYISQVVAPHPYCSSGTAYYVWLNNQWVVVHSPQGLALDEFPCNTTRTCKYRCKYRCRH
jgi:hypothetical protein